MSAKYWDIKRSPREKWTTADYDIYRWIKSLETKGGVTFSINDLEETYTLVVLDKTKPSNSKIYQEKVSVI